MWQDDNQDLPSQVLNIFWSLRRLSLLNNMRDQPYDKEAGTLIPYPLRKKKGGWKLIAICQLSDCMTTCLRPKSYKEEDLFSLSFWVSDFGGWPLLWGLCQGRTDSNNTWQSKAVHHVGAKKDRQQGGGFLIPKDLTCFHLSTASLPLNGATGYTHPINTQVFKGAYTSHKSSIIIQ